ncbi:MAG: PDZ domain-containing protein [Alphaproteobacteria bacterium]|nr:PDZ domain-containing protein [Alphaproteobacteria bacterium]
MTRRGRILVLVLAVLVALLGALWLGRDDVPAPEPPVAAAAPKPARPALRVPKLVEDPAVEPVKAEPPAKAQAADPRLWILCALPSDLAAATTASFNDPTWLGAHGGKVIDGALRLPAPRGEMDPGTDPPTARIYVDDGAPEAPAVSTKGPRGRAQLPTETVYRSALVGRTRTLTLAFDGIGEADADVMWTEAGWTCRLGPVRPYGYVTGRVITHTGVDDARVRVVGCGATTGVDRDGGFFMEVAPEPCTLRAVRLDGAFLLRSAPVRVDPTSGVDIVLDLGLPDYEASGVGVAIEEHDLGIRVRQVFPDTPASDAGLRPGDIIVALDGVPTVELDSHGFVDLAVGAPGTDVTYTVLRGDREVDIDMTREPMARPEM